MQQQDFFLAGRQVQPALNRVTQDGTEQELAPRLMRLLVYLAERPGEVCTREALLAAVWSGLVVTEDSLTQAISELRKVFGDDPRQPTVIRTIRNVGYQLIATPTPVSAAAPGPLPEAHLLSARRPWRRWVGGAVGLLVVGYLTAAWLQAPAPAPLVPVPLTSYPGYEFDPALAPDGDQIAFVWSDPSGNIGLRLKRLDAAQPTTLTENTGPGFDGSPAWAPDGRALAFMRSTEEGCAVFIQALPSGDRRRLAPCQFHSEHAVAWSPDDRWIAFSDRSGPEAPFQIHLVAPATGEHRLLTEPPPGLFGDLFPTFSPDGQQVAFLRGVVQGALARVASPAIGDVFVTSLDGGTPWQLTHDNQEFPGMTWLPDGERLLVASNRHTGTFGLWMVPLDGGPIHPLMQLTDVLRFPTYAPATRQLVFQRSDRVTNLWRLRLGDTTATAAPILVSTRSESMPAYSPDGTQLAFASDRTGHSEIWLSDAAGQRPVQRTHFGGPHTTAPRWSPDGRQIVFESWAAGQADIYVMPAQGGTPLRLTQDAANDMVPHWSRDGQWIYFGSNRSGRWQVWKMPATGGAAEQVTQEGGFLAMESTHAADPALFFARLDVNGPWRQPLEGSAPAAPAATGWSLWSKDWGNWALHGDDLYFVSRSGRFEAALARVHLPSERVDTLAMVAGDAIWSLPGVSVSPDGQWIVYTQLDQANGDLMRVDGVAW